jgi:tetratricopeptide (TPR) repeat protein
MSLIAVPFLAAAQASLAPNTMVGATDSVIPAASSIDGASSDAIVPDFVRLGNQLMAEHQFQAALQAYQNVQHPTPKVWSSMGRAYQLLYDFDDAVRCDLEAVKGDPHNARLLNNLGTAYDQRGDHRQAESLYREAIRIGPESAVYYKNLGTNLLAQDEPEQGAVAYEQALALDPHVLDGHTASALAEPRRANAETNYAKSRSCAQAGLIDCTVMYLRKALDEGAATPATIASDRFFAGVRNSPAIRQLLMEER